MSNTVVIFDFETTGLSPNMGDRTIEVGAVKLCDGEIVERYQSLMNPQMRISGFIESFTGITNNMLASAPTILEVMAELKNFMGDHKLVAHNASFDLRFLDAEMLRLRHKRTNQFACSMLTSRRIYPEAPNCKLETLVRFKKLKTDGVHHRALADAEMTTHLWMKIIEDIKDDYKLDSVPFELIQKISKVPKNKVPDLISKYF